MLTFFNENIRRDWYKKSFLTQYIKREIGDKKAHLTQNVRWGWLY